MIKAITFDYGGVLKIDPEDNLSKIIEYLETTKEEWEKEWFKINRLAHTGIKTHEEVFLLACLKFKTGKDTEDNIKELLEENKGKHIINRELVKTITYLKDKGFKIGLISNYGIELRDKIRNDGVYDLFDAIIISAEVGYQKPDPEIFQLAFSELGVKPEEVVFVDDAPKSLENSESIGYFPILYKDNESFKAELEKILEINL